MPYVRRANGRETGETLRMAIRLAFYNQRGRPFFVMVQHGFPNNAIECGATKRDVQQSPTLVALGMCTFRQWSRRAARSASGRKPKQKGNA